MERRPARLLTLIGPLGRLARPTLLWAYFRLCPNRYNEFRAAELACSRGCGVVMGMLAIESSRIIDPVLVGYLDRGESLVNI
jgi:hypothetical protein